MPKKKKTRLFEQKPTRFIPLCMEIYHLNIVTTFLGSTPSKDSWMVGHNLIVYVYRVREEKTIILYSFNKEQLMKLDCVLGFKQTKLYNIFPKN